MIFLASKLKKFREESGYSQQQISDLLGCDRSTYTYYETGRTRPDIIVLGALCKILGIKYEQLISEDDGSMILSDNTPDNSSETQPDETVEKIYELSKKEREVVAYFRLMNDKGREKLLKKLESENKKDHKFTNLNCKSNSK